MKYENPRKQPGGRPETVRLGEREFEFVRVQRGEQSVVYRAEDAYLRIGTPEKIATDVERHKKMEAAGFPVAKLLDEGLQGDQAYFVESSLGTEHFGKLFAEEVERAGAISEETFGEFVSVAEQFARAQLTTASPSGNYDEFASGIILDQLCAELPERAPQIRARFTEVKERTATLPFVVTHGDFNPHNLFPAGVIDLDDSFHAPYGYDLVSAITHIDNFPDSDDYEYFAKYRFSPEQVQKYYKQLDGISLGANYRLCRASGMILNSVERRGT